tara:strand:+ start:509 stop:1576 length:1068 start_codon:yes stop_codon:yes gene_type:complete
MSIARGLLTGFLKEGLEQKAARDEMYADMVRETGQEFRKTAQLFRQDEKDIERRFNIVSAAHGPNAGLYASYNKLLDSDAGAKLVVDQLGKNPELKKQIEDFDFQGYNFNTSKTQRFMNFKDQQKDVINLITKNQGSGPVAELFFKDMKAMDTGTQVTRPELDLPDLGVGTGTSAISADDMRQFRSAAFSEFKSMEKDEFSKEFKNTFSEGYDPDKDGPSKDLYSFNRYFTEFYLPKVLGTKTDTSMKTQMEDVTGAQQTGETTTFNMDNTFTFNGKLYNIPDQFKGQSIPEITKRSLASQQDKEAPTKNNPNVMSAQNAINIIKAQNPNDPRIEDIKRDLRLILGVTNLDGLIL